MADDIDPKDVPKILKDIVDLTAAFQSQVKEINKSTNNLGKGMGFLVDQTQAATDAAERQKKALSISENLGAHILKNEGDILKLKNKIFLSPLTSAEQEVLDALEKQNVTLTKNKKTTDDISQSEGDKLKKLNAQNSIYSTFLKPVIGDSKEYNKLTELGGKLMKGGWGAVLAIIDAAFDRFIALDKAAGAFRQKTGLILPQMKGIASAVRETNVEMQNLGVSLDKAYEAAGDLVESFQTAALVTKDMIGFSSQLSANVGLATKDIAEFSSKFSETGASSGITAKNIVLAGTAMATMAGVAPKQAMNDVATASENTLKFLAKSPIQMMRAAVEARRMGTSLKSIADSARGMLDYQSSITSELEASALLNKNISFQASRQLAWEGKLVESREMALKQIQQAGDFTKMNLYQQEALAKAAGMTVEEVIKQTNQEKALNTVRLHGTDEQKKNMAKYDEHMKKMRQNHKKTMAETIAEGDAIAKQMNMQARMQQLTDAIAAIWTKISDALEPAGEAVIQIFEHIKPLAEKIMPALVPIFQILGFTFAIIGAAINGILDAITDLLPDFSKMTVFGESLGDYMKEVGVALKTYVLPAFSFLGKLIGYVAGGILMLVAAFSPITWAIYGIIKLFQIMKKIFTDIMDVWYDSSLSFGDKIKNMGKAIGIGILDGIRSIGDDLVAVIQWPFEKAIGWLYEMFLSNSPSGIGLGIVDGIKAAGGMIFDFLCSPFTKAWEMIKKIPFVSKLFGAVGDASKAVGGEISAKIEAATSSLVEIKNLDELKTGLDALTKAILRGTGTATAAQAGGDTGVAAKIDELITLFKTGGVAVNLDGKKVSSGLAPYGR